MQCEHMDNGLDRMSQIAMLDPVRFAKKIKMLPPMHNRATVIKVASGNLTFETLSRFTDEHLKPLRSSADRV